MACTSIRQRADEDLAKGRFESAIGAYDGILVREPNNSEVRAQRARARQGLVREILARARGDRERGQPDAALAELDRVLLKRHDWQEDIEAPLGAAIDTEVRAGTERIEKVVSPWIESRRPLRAQEALKQYAATRHEEFVAVRQRLADRIQGVGRAVCSDLRGRQEGPYFANVTSRYCAHFGEAAPAPLLPHARAGLDADGAVSGVPSELSLALRARVGSWFQKTIWFHGSAPERGRATITGKIDIRMSERSMRVTKPWTEMVPYTAYETYQEPYQEPYTATESYPQTVPYSETEFYSYPCGRGTCSGTRPVTRYRTEYRTRIVTRYRTAYRTLTRPVIRHRPEPRSFEYEATEVSGAYASDLGIAVDRGPGASPFVVSVNDATTRTGIEHHASFPPAGVFPQKHGLPDQPAYFDAQSGRLGAAFVAAMNRRYVEVHCTIAAYSVEEAARCAYGLEGDAPANVDKVFQSLFDEDAQLVLKEFARWRKNSP